ncbi:MAG: NAD+ synthase [Bacteroidota bacterium]|nr:NAD+ synthase [Bacteroidota bacterium]MXW14253.1 NAD+ synthase [Rhodothermaceae bacterium]MDE2645171.1 NAD+ synthase [Bacteroidota bacterium]MXW31504.1 NAD+ synthase [Rhodothermaceae bacterium]MXZ17681.1 NAD+ synthase [Rhodothermaceae bacterium]
MKLALAQINTVVGDLRGNSEKILYYSEKAHARGADLVVFPELTFTGYPPIDLLESKDFVTREQQQRQRLAKLLPRGLGVLLGGLAHHTGHGKPLHNAAYLYEDGHCVGVYHKQLLPTYDVFDELRYFAPGSSPAVLRWRGLNLGVHVCEDLWNVHDLNRKPYSHDPVATLAAQSPDIFINLCASPFAIDKHLERYALMETVHQKYGRPYVFTNLVGANTDLIFDGRSCVMHGGNVLEAPAFEEALLEWDTEKTPKSKTVSIPARKQVREALTLGIRDYMNKTGIQREVIIGLSGGIDSAVTATLAVRALGPEQVIGVSMPSNFSSKGSKDDARHLASNLGIKLITIPIQPLMDAFKDALRKPFEKYNQDVTEENIQARIRGTLVMAFANKYGGMVLATGNKSELAMGYATLYGDMSGGLAVLGDLYKTEVYELAKLLNRPKRIIPESTMRKPPSAELSPGQKDLDSLPPYDILDRILKQYIEQLMSVKETAEFLDYDEDLVQEIVRQVNWTEFKRRQAAPVLRLRPKAFGSGRREPIVARRP